MTRFSLFALTALLVTLFAADASAAKKKKQQAEPPPEPAPEVEQSCPELVQENSLEGCRDTLDNDADGHVDCDDQDCEIYSMCVTAPTAKPAAARPTPTFSNMAQLKQARHARQITPAEYHRAWNALRQARAIELEQLRAAYHSGQLDKHAYRDERRAIIARYEG
ncbi:MAG: hypothetical protein JRF63_12035 [Deltaproteobacteria bacterium]|nr:hypothetical protein [Deltaproteobacteria bacterium]